MSNRLPDPILVSVDIDSNISDKERSEKRDNFKKALVKMVYKAEKTKREKEENLDEGY